MRKYISLLLVFTLLFSLSVPVVSATDTVSDITTEAETESTESPEPSADPEVLEADTSEPPPASEDPEIVDGLSEEKVETPVTEETESSTLDTGETEEEVAEDPPEAPAATVIPHTSYTSDTKTVTHEPYIFGTDLGLVVPDGLMTRAEAAQMFYNLKEKPETKENPWSDVPDTAWYAKAILALTAVGTVSGDGTEFRPKEPITRAELTEFLVRFMDTYIYKTGESKFPDVQYGDEYFPYILTAEKRGWLIGDEDGYFRPDDYITRAEVVTAMNRILGRSNCDLDDFVSVFPDLQDASAWYYHDLMEATQKHHVNETTSYTKVWYEEVRPRPSSEPSTEPSAEPSESPEASVAPSEEPEPSESPIQSEEPEPSEEPESSEDPGPSESPVPSTEPDPSPSEQPLPSEKPDPITIYRWVADDAVVFEEYGPEELDADYHDVPEKTGYTGAWSEAEITADNDGNEIHTFTAIYTINSAILAPQNTWLTNGVAESSFPTLTSVNFCLTADDAINIYNIDLNDTSTIWNASTNVAKNSDGTYAITGYLIGTDVYIIGSNLGIIKMNPNSSYMFTNTTGYAPNAFKALTNGFNGVELLDASDVVDMSYMFQRTFFYCDSLGPNPLPNISGWDVSNVTNMSYMFNGTFLGATVDSISFPDISSWDTSAVTNMLGMFAYTFCSCSALSLWFPDISGWNTDAVTNITSMFDQTFVSCSNLITIWVPAGTDFNNLVTASGSVPGSYGMFGGDISLIGGDGTTYSSSHVGLEYARVDGLNDAPGYFTYEYLFKTYRWIVDDTVLFEEQSIKKLSADYHDVPEKDGYAGTWSEAVVTTDSDGNKIYTYTAIYTVITLAAQNTWLTNGVAISDWPTLTSVNFCLTADDAATTYNVDLSKASTTWNASTNTTKNSDGVYAITGYLVGTDVYIVGNNLDIIKMNADSSYMFSSGSNSYAFEALTGGFNGAELLDASSVTNMSSMFYLTFFNCINLTSSSLPDISGWDTSSVTSMRYIFYHTFTSCFGLTTVSLPNISNWDTSAVTDMEHMFYFTFSNCTRLTSASLPDISGWDTGAVTNMNYMFWGTFCGCASLAPASLPDISNWDTSAVTDMSYMFGNTFYGCASLTPASLPDISNWDTSAVTDMSYMFGDTFHGCTGLTSASLPDISNWDTSAVTDMSYMFEGTFYKCAGLTSASLPDISGWNTGAVTDTSYIFGSTFYNCTGLTSASLPDISAWDTSSVTDMSYMFDNTFYDCTKLTSASLPDISAWDTSAVTNMSHMFGDTFNGCTGLTFASLSDISKWDTSKVASMNSMFYYTFYDCINLTSASLPDISGWDISNAIDLAEMFSSVFDKCINSTFIYFPDISGWDVSNVEYMYGMFSEAFNDCANLTSVVLPNISNWDMSNVTDAASMFDGVFLYCNKLETIYAPAGTNYNKLGEKAGDHIGCDLMFFFCTSLVGGNGTEYSESHTGLARAKVDGLDGTPGYFTAIE